MVRMQKKQDKTLKIITDSNFLRVSVVSENNFDVIFSSSLA